MSGLGLLGSNVYYIAVMSGIGLLSSSVYYVAVMSKVKSDLLFITHMILCIKRLEELNELGRQEFKRQNSW